MTRPDLSILLFDLAPSGVVRNALRIARAAQQAGLITEIWSAQDHGEMRDAIPDSVPVRTLGLTLGGDYSRSERRRASLSAANALARLLLEQRPRVLLSAGNHVHPLAVKALAAAGPTETRLIGRVSNSLPRFSWSPLLILPSIVARLRARQRFLAMDRLVAVSEDIRLGLVKTLRISPGRVRVIPNGIDLDEVRILGQQPLDHPWLAQGQPPVVLGIGRLVPQKNFALLLRAFAHARRRMPMRLILLGAGVQREALERLACKLDISADVEFAGHVDNPAAYLSRADLFVLPSRWEGMSNALLEALASGCPVIATRCSGSAELLEDGLWGSLVASGDLDEMSRKILENLQDPPTCEWRVQRAARYGLKTSMARYVQLFREELGPQVQATERAPRTALPVQSRNSSSNIGWAKT